ncbi:MAG TPA: DEAD/DEAH box helicase [Sporichthyaceae bacterium]|jgi:DEAD/DEAH box helicase domain-containing protein|nr:DEAD/DEAH box helicase [Sporichthyaceae bacterium]
MANQRAGAATRPDSAAVLTTAVLTAAVLDGPAAAVLLNRIDRITHVRRIPQRPGRTVDWPIWVPQALTERWAAAGIYAPWAHQAAAAEVVRGGGSAVLCTGTASGKSLAYLMPGLSALWEDGARRGRTRSGNVLYLAPTKALAADQLSGLTGLGAGQWLRPALFDGDTPHPERDWIRRYANYLLTNPDMLNRTLLPAHNRWSRFLGSLRLVVVDECHAYRGVFGSHVAQVLRRLRRVCRIHGADPQFVLTSATVGDPAGTAEQLTGVAATPITEDASPRAATTVLLWEPPPVEGASNGSAGRRSAVAEAADLLAGLVLAGSQALAFVGSRRGAETVAVLAREALADCDPGLAACVAAYRGGYLPEERRLLENCLRSGELRGLATTNALELGIDVAGLDAVVMVGYPGTRAAMWQQAGRAGRGDGEALAVLIARDDPLDSYLIHHPEALFDRPAEAAVLDPANPYVLAPHLCAAAAEAPLTDDDLELFGPAAASTVEALTGAGLLRRRVTGWHWTRRDPTVLPDDIRGGGGPGIRLVELRTGRVLGTVDGARAHFTAHPGAVHLHQGRTYLVHSLDLDDGVALVERADPDYTTIARQVADIAVVEVSRTTRWGQAEIHFGSVDVTSQVVSYVSKRLRTGEIVAQTPLDLPEQCLRTAAVWWTLTDRQIAGSGIAAADLPGAAHAAEHASIGLLPLFATCDRWDIGGVSTATHADTGRLTVFVHDGHPGGAGFAERGHRVAAEWLRATRDLIRDCPCEHGCPSCVQSPKCGNGNRPLHKTGGARLLTVLLDDAPGL